MNFFRLRDDRRRRSQARAPFVRHTGVCAVDAVKPGLRLRRIAIANDLLEILQARGVDHREVAIL
jgi:hypothetical protein